MTETSEIILVLSALLHDIGKLVQRSSSKFKQKKHEEFGAEFLQRTLNVSPQVKEEVISLVLSHHRIPYSGNYPKLLNILKDADKDSAEHDRDEAEGVDTNINQTPLLSVYSYIDIGRNNTKKVSYKASILQLENLPYPEGWVRNSQMVYLNIKQNLERELKNLVIRDKEDINTLLYILLKYTKYISSAIYVSVPDIPLYDHLKTTAAIALCKYRGNIRDRYLLILGDLSGIQNFIFYNLKGGEKQVVDKEGTKRMRGRSLLVNLIIDSAVKYILEMLNLYEFNVLWQSGGTFLILAPNEKGVSDKLMEIKKNVNRFLLNEFGRLYLNMSWTAKNNLDDFTEILEELHTKMDDESKSKKYIEFMRDESFYITPPTDMFPCPACGVHFVNSDDEICETCKKITEMGDLVGKSKYLARGLNKDGLFTFDYKDLKISYSLTYRTEGFEDWEIFSMDDFNIPSVGKTKGFKIFKTHIPTSDSRVLSISQLTAAGNSLEERFESETKTKMGIFKADVDCLGKIFKEGLPKHLHKISRISTLSFLMDLFFTVEINNIAKEDNIYVIFSGGDDLTAVGRYDEIINFAKDVHYKFKKWVGDNENIHLSASIVFFGEKFPIRRAVNIAEDYLEEAKDYSPKISRCVDRGDKINIFQDTLTWEEFETQIEIGNELWEAQKNKEIASSLSHVLLTLHKLSPSFYSTKPLGKGDVVIPSPEPYLRYYFARRKDSRKDLLDKLSDEDIFKHIPVGVSIWVMNRKYKKEVSENVS